MEKGDDNQPKMKIKGWVKDGGWMVGPNDPDDGGGGSKRGNRSKRIEEIGDWS